MAWNDNMRLLSRDLWVMGAKCKPYDLKCFESKPGEVVNPLSGGVCSSYSTYELWHKPCSCIAKDQRPTSYTCPAAPWSTCNFPVPHSMFLVANMGNGLTLQEGVLNMQRHIAEFGPIYVSFMCKDEFLNWDWSVREIYTGGVIEKGGHAVMAVGWGSDRGLDYWLLRNSWGSGWGLAGYFKFKRGANVDKIEEWESSASMVDEHFADFAAPQCDFKQYFLPQRTLPSGKVCTYKIDMRFLCNKQASLSVMMSYFNNPSSYFPVQSQVPPGVETSLLADLKQRGFGLQSGEAKLIVTATDSAGNQARKDLTLTIPPTMGNPTSLASYADFDCPRD